MMMIKWILIIAMLKYSHGQTTEVLTELEEITCRANEKCTDHTYCQSDILIDLRLGNITCNHYSDVCCESSMISETPVNKTQNYEVPTECGVLNPNSVGMKIKETTDHEAQFGNVEFF